MEETNEPLPNLEIATASSVVLYPNIVLTGPNASSSWDIKF